jgi:aspartate aminotransferase
VPLGERLKYDPETLKEYITGRTRAIVLNSPSNPTGTIQTKAEVKAIAEIAEDKGITIISDEVYEHFIYDGEHVSPARFSDNVITVNASSKTYAMTGWRIGYVAARPEYTEQMLKVHQYVQACACSISQKAALAAITGPQDSVAMMRNEFRRRRDYLVSELHGMGLECVRPQGAFYAFPKVGDEARVVGELMKKGVISTPGTSFGKCGKGYLRLAYANSMPNIQKAVAIMNALVVQRIAPRRGTCQPFVTRMDETQPCGQRIGGAQNSGRRQQELPAIPIHRTRSQPAGLRKFRRNCSISSPRVQAASVSALPKPSRTRRSSRGSLRGL